MRLLAAITRAEVQCQASREQWRLSFTSHQLSPTIKVHHQTPFILRSNHRLHDTKFIFTTLSLLKSLPYPPILESFQAAHRSRTLPVRSPRPEVAGRSKNRNHVDLTQLTLPHLTTFHLGLHILRRQTENSMKLTKDSKS